MADTQHKSSPELEEMPWRDEDEIARREHTDRLYEAMRSGPRWNEDEIYPARREHAWRLRIEGLTYNEIGRRLTVTRERARQMVAKEIRQYHDLKEVIDLVVHIKRSTTKLS